MTEGEWWSCNPTDLDRMLAFLYERRASTRKVWLFACACCRGIWPLFTDPRSQAAVEVAERYVDGLVSRDALQAAGNLARAAIEDSEQPRALSIMAHRITRCEAREHWWTAAATAFADLLDASWRLERFRFTRRLTNGQRREMFDVAARLRDMFGPLPFRTVSMDRAVLEWNDHTVRKIAQAIYDEPDFTQVPILADALEEAGCDNEDILSHCRGPGAHSRGCWCVDLILDQT
jgi:hypothetical protein